MLSIWEKESFYARQDVIILGSGFVGLWSAYYLKKTRPSLKVSVIDRGNIPTGASTRNAGFACFGSLSELMQDAQTMGTDKMLQLVEMRFKGLRRIQKVFSSKEIDFDRCGGYELYDASDRITSEQLKENIQYLNSLLKPVTGTRHTFNLDDGNIAAFGFANTRHLVKNSLEGYLHSGKLVQGLLQMVQAMGVQVFNSIQVTSFQKVNNAIELITDKKLPFSTSQLLICTNAFTKELLPDLDMKPARGQVLLTSPISNLPWKGSFHSDEGYYYFRNLGDRVLLGGARNKAFAEEETTELATTDLIQNYLQQYLSTVILPGRTDYCIENAWSGIMAMGSEKMPIVQEVSANIFCAVRMSGMGVALAPVVGKMISRMMLKS